MGSLICRTFRGDMLSVAAAVAVKNTHRENCIHALRYFITF